MSNYSFTDPSVSNSSKVQQEMMDLKRRLALFAEEFGDAEEEYSYSSDEEEMGNNNQDLGASTSWENGTMESESLKMGEKGGHHSSGKGSSSLLSSSQGTTLASPLSSLGREAPNNGSSLGAGSSKIGQSSLYTPSTLSGRVSSSVSSMVSEKVGLSAERQPEKPSLPEPAKSDGSLDKNRSMSTKSRHSQAQNRPPSHREMPGEQQKSQSGAPTALARPAKERANVSAAASVAPVANAEPVPVAPAPVRAAAPALYVPQTGKKEKILEINGKLYGILNTIGKGGSSMVYEALDKEASKVVAVKQVDLAGAEPDVRKAFLNEIKLLDSLKDTNRVVKLFDHEHRDSEDVLFVVMEKGETDFSTHLKKRRREAKFENLVPAYWQEMLLAVQVIHKQGIVHSDLKPSNFLLVGGTFKLIDFGIARSVPKDVTSITMNCQMGTLNYMSPEAMNNISSASGAGKYKHITNIYSKMMAIMNGNPNRPHYIPFPPADDRGNTVDQQLLNVLKSCLRRDWKNRPTVEELLDHPYLKNTARHDGGKSEREGKGSLGLDPHSVWANSPRTNDRLLKQLVADSMKQQKRRLVDESA